MFSHKSLAIVCLTLSSPSWACHVCETNRCESGVCMCVPKNNCTVVPITRTITENAISIGIGPLDNLGNAIGNGLNNAAKAVEQGVKSVGKAVENIEKGVEKLGNDTLTTVQKAGGDSLKTLEIAGKDTVRTFEKAGGDTVKTFERAGRDSTATYIKGWKDSADQTVRSFNDTVDAGKAAANFTSSQFGAQVDAYKSAAKHLQEKDVINAMLDLSVKPLQASDENFFKATQESAVINAAASAAAAAYGPGGAAAYAAWSTYKSTGNADMAFRAGLFAAASAQAGASVAKMPSGTTGEILNKAAMAGAAGGIAVAAAGGDEKAVQEGFMKGAGTVLVQAGNDKARAFSPKIKNAMDTVQCISASAVDCISKTKWVRDIEGKFRFDSNGKPLIDTSQLDPQDYVGKWTKETEDEIATTKREIITKISMLPKTNAIPLMQNNWVLTWSLGKTPTIEHGKAQVVLTYAGPNPPFTSTVTYNKAGVLPDWATEQGFIAGGVTDYTCTLANLKRTVKVTQKANGCEAIYRRDDGLQQLVWHSDHFPDICIGKASEFVEDLRSQGIACQAQ